MKHVLPFMAMVLVLASCATPSGSDNELTHQPPAPTAAAHLMIISACYGSDTHYADVTARVNDLLRHPGLEFHASPQWLSADPTPGWNKALVIIYESEGRRHIFSTGEGGKVSAALLLAQ